MSKKKPETLIGLNIAPVVSVTAASDEKAPISVRQNTKELTAPNAWLSLADICRCLSISAAQGWRIVNDAEFAFVRRLKPSPRSHTRYFRGDFERYVESHMFTGAQGV